MATSAIEIPWSQYIPHVPTPKQHAYLWLQSREAFFGGAAGGGKSDALLMAALQYVNIPHYAAIIFRRSYTDLSLPGAIMDRAQEWLMGSDAKWNDNDKEFTFPSGATLTFAYLSRPKDKYRYQSAEFQFVGFDELTQFEEDDYLYLMSRLRRPSDGPLSTVPLRARGAANPGGSGHRWVKARFVDGRSPDRVFIPSGLDDNPHLDQAAYEQSLALLDPITHAQLRHGDWTVRPPGTYIFEADHIAAAADLGRRYMKDGFEVKFQEKHCGVDFGDFQTVIVGGYETERGGIYVPPQSVVYNSRADLEDISDDFEELMKPLDGWWKDIRYDSSFAQSARTVAKMLEKSMGKHNAVRKTGRPNTVPISFSHYKDLSVKYVRLLLKNTYDEKATRVLALAPAGEGNKKLIEQLEDLQGKETDPEKVMKGNDDGPDGLLALCAPLARKHRHIIERLEQEAKSKKPLAVLQPLDDIPPTKQLTKEQAA